LAKKRDKIKMSEEEVARFLDEQRVMTVSSLSQDGWPHVTALWYVMRDGEPWIYTYARSQKVRNLERDERATLLVESGHEYHELRGVMLKVRAEIHRDLDTVAGVAEELAGRYHTGGDLAIDDQGRAALRSQAAKRVAVRFLVQQVVTWDHAKLGGAY
jgi:PPOX class probable F420-dependent enzyme